MKLHTKAHKLSIKRFKTLEQDCIKIHNNLYTYNNFIYNKMSTESWITCSIHGDFEMNIHNHLYGQGCPKCGIIKCAKNRVKPQDQFIKECKEIHIKDRYLYDRTVYKEQREEIEVYCTICKEYFWQLAGNHLAGKGCRVCANNQKLLHNHFIEKAENVHGIGRYNYLENYTNAHTIFKAECSICDYKFPITGNNHLNGRGCPKCAKYGFDPSKSAILYYICIDETYYKIGITNLTTKKRFGKDFSRIRVVKEWKYDLGKEARDREQIIIKEFKDSLVGKYIKILSKTKNTEIFNRDVLLLD